MFVVNSFIGSICPAINPTPSTAAYPELILAKHINIGGKGG